LVSLFVEVQLELLLIPTKTLTLLLFSIILYSRLVVTKEPTLLLEIRQEHKQFNIAIKINSKLF